MKTLFLLHALLLWALMTLSGQPFDFRMPNTNFLLVPGGGFESQAWVDVPPGDSVILSTTAGTGLMALFQPSTVKQSRYVYLVVISVDSALVQNQSLTVCARCSNDSITKTLQISNANNGHGFYLVDSARTLLDTAFKYLKHALPAQKIYINYIHQLPWTACFPYPPLLIVTHHLFVYDNWRATVLWHNMIPPHDWSKIFIYNEEVDTCYGVKIDTWGDFSIIPCEIMHYNQQDTIMNLPEIAESDLFSLCPNPAGDNLYISLREGVSFPVGLTVLNIAGRIVQRVELTDRESTINLEQLAAGIYIVKVCTPEGCTATKVVKR